MRSELGAPQIEDICVRDMFEGVYRTSTGVSPIEEEKRWLIQGIFVPDECSEVRRGDYGRRLKKLLIVLLSELKGRGGLNEDYLVEKVQKLCHRFGEELLIG